MLAHRVRIKCSNAFHGVESIVCNNDRAAYLLVHRSAHRQRRTVWRVSLAAWIRYIYSYPCRRGITRELLQFVVNAPGVPFFLATYIEINCGYAPSLRAKCTLSSNIRRNENIGRLENTALRYNVRNPMKISHVNHSYAATDHLFILVLLKIYRIFHDCV